MEIIENPLLLFDKEKGNNIVGVDEAGRGPLAGPVVACAAILKNYNKSLITINDSKKLTEKKRENLFDIIKDHFYTGVGIADPNEIDEINILNATFLAMIRAIEDLKKNFDNIDLENDYLTLVDGNFNIKNYNGKQEPIIKGDGHSLSIAAASIIAKVTRDRIMLIEDKKYPIYGFEKHKGYGTKAHIKALKENGPSPIHRESFLKNILGDSNLTLDFS
ncbi:ribonuclease HII [Fusobacterium sp. PH5-44]|uniref:ribonuclease HII n=1 Tax=unclassified Fusobacterium TaxID=2648384 RepID=UPI003D1FC09F